jgi:hypothetical protein
LVTWGNPRSSNYAIFVDAFWCFGETLGHPILVTWENPRSSNFAIFVDAVWCL